MTPALAAKTLVSQTHACAASTESDRAHEEELRRFIFQQVAQAEYEVLRKSPDVDVDAATRFLRQVRRRRVVV